MNCIPNLTFNGKTEEAMTFYAKATGCELRVVKLKDMPPNPEFPVPPEAANRVAHSDLRKNGVDLITANDCYDFQETTFGTGVSVLFYFDTVAEIENACKVLSEGGFVIMPLAEVFWAERYAMLKDKFGVTWMLNYYGSKAPQ